MKIFSIDSTSATARIAVTDGRKLIKEVESPFVHWDDMITGDIQGLMQDFLKIIDIFFESLEIGWSDIDYICYNGCSGFKVSVQLGEILANILGGFYKKEVISVDHITAHYFSIFVDNEEEPIFPKLVFSASGSHNSLVYFKDIGNMHILNDSTYFDDREGKYIGLGSIYNRTLRSLEILSEKQSPQEIPSVLAQLDYKINPKIVQECRILYKPSQLFDVDMYQFSIACKPVFKKFKTHINNGELFFSFEQALFEILGEKFDSILDVMPAKEITIVGGISQNEYFIRFLEKKYQKKGISIRRPLLNYRFDNAAMLGVLAYYMKNNNVLYPFSHIIT